MDTNLTFSSASEKPRPARTRRLYLTVGQRTTGLSLSTGRGASLTAFSARALRRDFFLPGYCIALSGLMCTTGAAALRVMRGDLPGRSARGHGAASPCGSLRCESAEIIHLRGVYGCTVVGQLLVVLERHLGGAAVCRCVLSSKSSSSTCRGAIRKFVGLACVLA